jgi:cytochrome c2
MLRNKPSLATGVAAVAAIAAVCAAAALATQRGGERMVLARTLTGGDPAPAPALMIRYGCGGCHTIPGVPGADGRVAPALQGLIDRVYIGGVAQNTADNLVAWIVNPQFFSPHAAMPPTGIATPEARDVAAWLYAH